MAVFGKFAMYLGALIVMQLLMKNISKDANYRPCTSLGESLATDGPVPMLLTALVRSNYSEKDEKDEKDTLGQHCLETNLIADADKRILENVDESAFWKTKLEAIADSIKKINCTEPAEEEDSTKGGGNGKSPGKDMTLICTLLRKQILYYPNNSQIAVQIMEAVKKVIQDFDTVIYGSPSTKTTLMSTEKFRQTIRKSLLQVPTGNRILGFETLKDLQDHTFSLSKKTNSSKMPTRFPGIWAILSFQDMPSDIKAIDAVKLPFSILYDSQMADLEKEAQRDETFWLQDLVEQAIVEVASGRKVDIGTVLKKNPSKCWHKPSSYILMFFVYIYTILVFADQPAVFLSEILTEKELKLREYLYIMGVNSMTLKLSWILFYCIMLVPMSLIWATAIVFFYGSFISLSNKVFIYMLLMGHNVGMICFAYMLSNFFQTSKNSRLFIYVTTALAAVIALWRFNPGMGVQDTIFARCLSLHPATPFVIGMKYMIEWEKNWVGVTWANIWMSPTSTDTYHGFGEALTWIAADILLYMFLAWYMEKLFPGEFGQRHPFYFPCMPSYWLSPQQTIPQIIIEPKADVEPVHDKEPGIVINKLSKIYSNGTMGLNQLSLMFYKNEITAFIGHNGAGKSTAMNCLVGMVSPSGGTATIAGYDIRKDIDKVRQLVGFVPQYDILYPEFTVRDHCMFYGWLKKMSTGDIEKFMKMMMGKLGLEKMVDQKTVNLSGGQKRKLSIMTAYLGSPQVVIFDEPTSGIDPFSRRGIWSIILEHKSTTTTILSTHFMDEAEIIGNRIAIIDEGELKCAGSPMYLKNKCGKGYRLTIARRLEAKDSVTQFITKLLPNSQLIEELGNDMDFQISKETAHSDEMITILQEIEDNFESVGILSYALNEPSLKDVFFTCTAAENMKQDQHQPAEKVTESSDQLQYRKSTSNIGQQAAALMMKKFWCSIRSPSLIVFQTVIPLIFVAFVILGAVNEGGAQKDMKELVRLPVPIEHNLLFMHDYDDENATNEYLQSAFKHGYPPICPCEKSKSVPESMKTITSNRKFDPDQTCGDECKRFCDRSNEANKEANGILPSGDKMFALGKAVNASSWILLANQSHENVLVGFQFHNGNSSAENTSTSSRYVTVFYHSRVRHAALNLWHTALIRYLTNSEKEIQMFFEPKDLADPTLTKPVDGMASLFSQMINGVFLAFAFVFGTFGLVIALINETHTGLKRLQLIYGANPYVFWAVNLAFDMLLFMGTVVLIVIPIAIFENDYKNNAGELLVVGLLFGYQALTFMYLISFINSKDGNDINRYIFYCIFGCYMGLSLVLSNFVIDKCMESNKCAMDGIALPNKTCGDLYQYVMMFISHVASIVPSWVLGEAVYAIGYYNQNLPMQPTFEMQCQKMGCMCPYLNVFSFPLLGQRLLKFVLWGTLNLIVVMVLERCDFRCSCSCAGQGEQVVWSKQSSDTDVAAEQERVKSGGLSDLTHPLIVKNLCKSFKGMSKLTPAVNNISFAVAKAETFGLLGLNGAGKTTTFNMLTGFEKPNSGSAAILGMDMLSHNSKRFKNASYCPQENRLFSKLTIEQHLMMVAALRGVPHDVTNELLERLIREVGLDSQKGKRAGTLSGGNQRKLNFAMALIDYRPVIFLDEPTTGMDPGAKRQAWDCIKHATARGCSVVLTSHSMEECEALCHRLVIMATGSFLCIGSVQYLKHKFGDEYIFKIKLQEQAASWDQLNEVRKFVEANLATAILMEEHGAVLSYEIPRSQTLKLSHLSQVMLTCRRTFPVEDISVRQSSLEEIFITMGKNQDEGKAAATPNQAPKAPIQTPAAANKAPSDPEPVAPKPLKTPGSSGGSSGSDADENKKEKDVV